MRQSLEALLLEERVTNSYDPEHILQQSGGRGSNDGHEHTRIYLGAFEAGCCDECVLPKFFAKLQRKRQSEVLRALPPHEAVEMLRKEGERENLMYLAHTGMFVS